MKIVVKATWVMAAFFAAALLMGLAGCAPAGVEGGNSTGAGAAGPTQAAGPSGQPTNSLSHPIGIMKTPGVLSPNLPPEIAGLHPLEQTQACLHPQIGVDLVLTDAMRKNGSFDLSTITLTLDGNDVTREATVVESLSSPHDRVSVLYTPTTDLTMGSHHVTILIPSASGPENFEWIFVVADIPCR